MTARLRPALPDLLDPVVVSTFGPYSQVPQIPGATAPSSGSIGTASCSLWYPMWFPRAYPVAAVFWENGSTVGTNSVDFGVYKMRSGSAVCDRLYSTGSTLSAGASAAQTIAASFTIPVGQCYFVINCNGTTATFLRTAYAITIGKMQGMLELTSSFALPSTATPVALTAQRSTVLCGVAQRTTI